MLVGKDLIKSAEIRSVIKDIETYRTAVNTFKLKYNCLAGDCPNATAYFGVQDPTPATCQITASADMLTCDGNGNGKVDVGYEIFRFWQHLANAGLIAGKFTGVVTSGGVSWRSSVGINCPKTAISDKVGFSFGYQDYSALTSVNAYSMNYGNMFWLGQESSGVTLGGAFTPTEALAIDQKIDDGKPGKGYILPRSITDAYAQTNIPWGSANACTTSVDYKDYDGDYKTSVDQKVCSFFIKSGL